MTGLRDLEHLNTGLGDTVNLETTPQMPMPSVSGVRDKSSEAASMRAISLSLTAPQRLYAGLAAGGCREPDRSRDAEASIALKFGRAWKAVLTLDNGNTETLVARLEAALDGLAPEMARRYRDQIEILRAVRLVLCDDGLAALPYVVGYCRNGKEKFAGIASTVCRFGYWKLGDLDRFHAMGRSARTASPGRRRALQSVYDLAIDAAVEFEQLRLPAAKRLALDALATANSLRERDFAVASLPSSIAARVLYEEGYLDQAETMIGSRLSAVAVGGTIEGAICAYLVMARIALHRQQVQLASMILQEAEALGERKAWPRLVAASIAERLDLLLQRDRVDEAEACAERLERLAGHRQHGDSVARAEIRRFAVLGRCRVTLARGASRSSVGTLRRIHHEAVASRNLYRGFRLGLLLAEALALIGEMDEALAILQEALRIGATVGLYQAFLDSGPRIASLLDHLYVRGPSMDDGPDSPRSFLGSLLDHKIASETPAGGRKERLRSGNRLSEREHIILKYISQGQSNKRIAQVLDIAPETVKSHVKRIFVKLAVGTRAEAVGRGESLGLI